MKHKCTEQSEPGWVYSLWTPCWDRGPGETYLDVQPDPFIRAWEQTCVYYTSTERNSSPKTENVIIRSHSLTLQIIL